RHFPTKEGLFEAVILSHVEQLADRVRAISSAPDPGTAFFEFCVHCAKQGAANVALAQALGGVSSSTHTKVTAAVADMHGSLAEVLVNLQDRGVIRRDVTVADLNGFFAGVHAAAEHNPGDPEIPTRMMEIVCDGLRTTRAVSRA
ncbi:TetR/AcrR family transcriptional regulator, partial [Actinosynnema sp. NPDC023658]|uniref:TetR/AcrR family transcriptional regulator n=1 Tax=Actinosynnema sp. NPDC023658 TaxID=3155465 RepID=UPI0033FB31C3